MEGSKAKIRIDGKISRSFEIAVGVRQGDALSTVLFNLALHRVIEKLNLRGRTNTNSSCTNPSKPAHTLTILYL